MGSARLVLRDDLGGRGDGASGGGAMLGYVGVGIRIGLRNGREGYREWWEAYGGVLGFEREVGSEGISIEAGTWC